MTQCPFCDESIPPGATSCPHCRGPILGEPSAPPSDDLEPRVRALLEADQKIEAIKLYREQTGQGLAEAKQAVEAWQHGTPLPERDLPDESAWLPEVLQLLERGKKIEAIKVYRAHHGVGLKDARLAVEALGTRHGIAPSGGCLGAVFALALLLLMPGLLLVGSWW